MRLDSGLPRMGQSKGRSRPARLRQIPCKARQPPRRSGLISVSQSSSSFVLLAAMALNRPRLHAKVRAWPRAVQANPYAIQAISLVLRGAKRVLLHAGEAD